jgi:hypothetical protein
VGIVLANGAACSGLRKLLVTTMLVQCLLEQLLDNGRVKKTLSGHNYHQAQQEQEAAFRRERGKQARKLELCCVRGELLIAS